MPYELFLRSHKTQHVCYRQKIKRQAISAFILFYVIMMVKLCGSCQKKFLLIALLQLIKQETDAFQAIEYPISQWGSSFRIKLLMDATLVAAWVVASSVSVIHWKLNFRFFFVDGYMKDFFPTSSSLSMISEWQNRHRPVIYVSLCCMSCM